MNTHRHLGFCVSACYSCCSCFCCYILLLPALRRCCCLVGGGGGRRCQLCSLARRTCSHPSCGLNCKSTRDREPVRGEFAWVCPILHRLSTWTMGAPGRGAHDRREPPTRLSALLLPPAPVHQPRSPGPRRPHAQTHTMAPVKPAAPVQKLPVAPKKVGDQSGAIGAAISPLQACPGARCRRPPPLSLPAPALHPCRSSTPSRRRRERQRMISAPCEWLRSKRASA